MLLQKAAQSYKNSEYEKALQLYKQAANIYGIKNVQANISLCEKKILDLTVKNQAPPKRKEILTAHEIFRNGRPQLAIDYAKKYLPSHLSHTLYALQANCALQKGDEAGWLKNINIYLDKYGVSPISLKAYGSILDRLTTATLPPIHNKNKISIIMPAYNSEETIEPAAKSILQQTWKNIELIIIDDYSSDSTWAKAQRIASTDKRVKLLRNAANIGPYASKNIALKIATGKYITGHDADDWAHPQRLELHMAEIIKSNFTVKASTTDMIRIEPNGMLDRFAWISSFSHDGVAREASISCLIERDFFVKSLGGWDCVKFGADSELIARCKTILGSNFAHYKQVTMVCLNMEGSLTNNKEYGVDRLTGPSEIRQQYSKSWLDWHQKIAKGEVKDTKLAFPPSPKLSERKFPAPSMALVNIQKIKRNYYTLIKSDEVSKHHVTAICVTKRHYFLSRVFNMLNEQTHKNLEVIIVLHGDFEVGDHLEEKFNNSNKKFKLLHFNTPGSTLGDALNYGIEHCKTDIVAKIDDDDFYGKNYIHRLLSTLVTSNDNKTGIVGKGRAYCYIQEADLFGLRYDNRYENNYRTRVFGGTIMWSRKILNDQRFISSNTGEDSNFFSQALESGIKIYSSDPYDYIHVRYANLNNHTWKISSEDFLKPVNVCSTGIRLDISYSSEEITQITPTPER